MSYINRDVIGRILLVCFEISAHAQWGAVCLGELDVVDSLSLTTLSFYVVIHASFE